MSPVSYDQFSAVYAASVQRVYAHWTPAMQDTLAQHCRSWSSDNFDFREYLKQSVKRFYLAYSQLSDRPHAHSVCDVGGFWGVFGITLSELGYQVTMTEALQYYDGCFDALFAAVRDSGVSILDCDLFAPDVKLEHQYDFVTIMAVMEHYPHSLKSFMDNVGGLLHADSLLYLEVPNIAYWNKRLQLLRGQTPLPDIREIYDSATPFIGHHHEFTMKELESLAEISGLQVLDRRCFNYSQTMSFARHVCSAPVEALAYLLVPLSREILSVVCQKPAA
ncbi:MAG: methyltransferase domain-containing protein [Planctomycetaceae bacterium]